jgi:hypothetical protein
LTLGTFVKLFKVFSEIKVISDPESIMMSERFSIGELIDTGTWAAEAPRKEHPGGLAMYLWSSTNGDPGLVGLDTVWYTLEIFLARFLLVAQFKGNFLVLVRSRPR